MIVPLFTWPAAPRPATLVSFIPVETCAPPFQRTLSTTYICTLRDHARGWQKKKSCPSWEECCDYIIVDLLASPVSRLNQIYFQPSLHGPHNLLHRLLERGSNPPFSTCPVIVFLQVYSSSYSQTQSERMSPFTSVHLIWTAPKLILWSMHVGPS